MAPHCVVTFPVAPAIFMAPAVSPSSMAQMVPGTITAHNLPGSVTLVHLLEGGCPTSDWIQMTVICAYEDEEMPPPSASNPHDLRVLTAMMSLHCNTLISDILSGCYWAIDLVFVNHYLCYMSIKDVNAPHLKHW